MAHGFIGLDTDLMLICSIKQVMNYELKNNKTVSNPLHPCAIAHYL